MRRLHDRGECGDWLFDGAESHFAIHLVGHDIRAHPMLDSGPDQLVHYVFERPRGFVTQRVYYVRLFNNFGGGVIVGGRAARDARRIGERIGSAISGCRRRRADAGPMRHNKHHTLRSVGRFGGGVGVCQCHHVCFIQFQILTEDEFASRPNSSYLLLTTQLLLSTNAYMVLLSSLSISLISVTNLSFVLFLFLKKSG